jgi:dipeptidase D
MANNSILADLEPKSLFRFFGEILSIPRPSKHEEKMTEYLVNWAKERNLEYVSDEIGNVIIRKGATKGKENSPWVCLQSHIDMVCEKNSDKDFDFEKDAIVPKIEGEWLKADGTTLGADDGIGVATALAILDANDIEHGPIECLFTVDEETGLSGAEALSADVLKSRILLNLDSEDEGEIFIGCAGGIDTVAKLPYDKEETPDAPAFKIMVKGLKGGHSGDDINKGLACANKILNRILWSLDKEMDLRLSCFEGGNLRNAIAREANATFVVAQADVELMKEIVERFAVDLKYEFRTTEPDLEITLSEAEKPAFVVDMLSQDNLLNVLYACPHGVLAMSREIPGFVETSTNLASVKMKEDHFFITTSQRSSVESAKYAAAYRVESCFLLAGADVEHGDGYPGWAPNPESKILKIAVDAYKKLFNKEPIVRAIHAGLECGLIGEKYPGMDMISYGPTLRGVHSPDERLEIKTVELYWKHTLEILKNI